FLCRDDVARRTFARREEPSEFVNLFRWTIDRFDLITPRWRRDFLQTNNNVVGTDRTLPKRNMIVIADIVVGHDANPILKWINRLLNFGKQGGRCIKLRILRTQSRGWL